MRDANLPMLVLEGPVNVTHMITFRRLCYLYFEPPALYSARGETSVHFRFYLLLLN